MDVVIRITNHEENPKKAIQSVINNAQLFKNIHIICPFYDGNTLPFEEYEAMRFSLSESGIKIYLCAELDANKLSDELVVELSPYTIIKTGGFDELTKIHKELQRTDNTTVTQFGICPTIYVPEQDVIPDLLDSILGYGFFLVTLFIDVLWRIYYRDKYYIHTDVKATRICAMGTQKFLPKVDGFITKFWNRLQLPTSSVASSMVVPLRNMRGFKFARWNLNLHPKQRIGFWMVTFVLVYFWVSYPWWNFFSVFQYVHRPFFHPLWLTLYIMITSMMYISTAYYTNIPHQFLLCMLHPIYFALYPIFWVYSKLYRPIPTIKTD